MVKPLIFLLHEFKVSQETPSPYPKSIMIGGPRKEQQKLFAFLGGASTGVWDGGSAQRTVGSLARREMEDAVTSLAQKYFAGLFQVQDTKKVDRVRSRW